NIIAARRTRHVTLDFIIRSDDSQRAASLLGESLTSQLESDIRIHSPNFIQRIHVFVILTRTCRMVSPRFPCAVQCAISAARLP
ncbi:hypothetical protein, partial [Aureimonas ureilytica]|uniref:hypothetical protein n=1 Tax=Aureimonas ureilytica TaxID=401562 RepID=UPI0019D4D7CA